MGQQYWTRSSGFDLPEGEKESSKWLSGLNAINSIASQSNKRIVAVEDREGDVFNFFKAEPNPNLDLLVRVDQACQLEIVSSGLVYKLPEGFVSLTRVWNRQSAHLSSKPRSRADS